MAFAFKTNGLKFAILSALSLIFIDLKKHILTKYPFSFEVDLNEQDDNYESTAPHVLPLFSDLNFTS